MAEYAGWRDEPVKALETKAIELWNTRPAIVEYGYATAQQKGNINGYYGQIGTCQQKAGRRL